MFHIVLPAFSIGLASYLAVLALCRGAQFVVFAFIALFSLWTPFLNPVFYHRWFDYSDILITAPVPILVALLTWRFWVGILGEHHATPFLCVIDWFILCFAGLGISI